MTDIHEVLEQAVTEGHLPPDATFRDRATVIKAFEEVRGAPFAVSSGIMGSAARDIMREHRATIALNTFKYAYWMLLTPDPVYRFHPGGAPGVNGQRDRHAELFDVGTYAFGAGSWNHILKNHRHHLPLDAKPRAATPLMRLPAMARIRATRCWPASGRPPGRKTCRSTCR